ncbi:MAG: hypothetical protein U1D55_06365 [Phycisphaerae bacterium]
MSKRALFPATISACLLIVGCSTFERSIPKRDADLAQEKRAQVRRAHIPKPIGDDRTRAARAIYPEEAFRWRQMSWKDENGQIAPDAPRRAIQEREANVAAAMLRGPGSIAGLDPAAWIEHGPNNVGGRTRALVIHPTNSQRMWAGAVSGGIWYSADGGLTWTPVNDDLPNLAICALAIDPTNPNILYAGTGEGLFNGDAIGGAGVYKSTDGGASWSRLASTAAWDNVCRIAISPTNGDVLLVAKRYGGILRSTDGGATWSTRLSAQGSYQVVFHPTDGNQAVAHVLDYDFTVSDWYHRAVYSTDGGLSWTTVTGGLSRQNGFYSRIELAYAPSQPSTVYASCAANNGQIWRSTDNGHSYTQQSTTPTSGVNWYANPIWVDPTNPNFLLTGGYDVYKSTDGGLTLAKISAGYLLTVQPHPDIHFFTHAPGFNGTTNRRVWVCTDGGMFYADNIYAASTSSGWTRRYDTYRTTQFYGGAGDGPTNRLVGGTQDNGSLVVNTPSTSAGLTFGGDGGFSAIDPTNANYVYGEYVYLQIHRSTNGGTSAAYIDSGLADAGSAANFIAPFILDPNDANVMLAGGHSLWRSGNVKAATPTWQTIRAAGTDNISAIAVTRGNPNAIWIGLNNGEVWRSSGTSPSTLTWTAVDNNAAADPLPNRYVTRILVDPDDANRVIVAFGGFSPDNLYRTLNGGASWADITGSGATGLPSAPIRGVARHPVVRNWLYVGTEVGIFASSDAGATWATTNLGPATVSVDEVVFLHQSTRLLAATHGRGLYTVQIQYIPGDLDHDGDVDSSDLGILLAAWRLTPAGDLDGDGDTDEADLGILLANWGRTN